MIGTNDLKTSFYLTAEEIANSVARLVDEITQSGCATFGTLLVAPPSIFEKGSFARQFFDGAEDKSKQLADYYQQSAKALGCDFFDASEVAAPLLDEGVHLAADQHRALAIAISAKVMTMLSSVACFD